MYRDPPRVEKLRSQHHSADQAPPWRHSGRVRLFVVSFALVALAGVAWTLLQPTVYRSSATVLMSAPSAIDDQAAEANIQNVAIQRRILLGREITGGVSQSMRDSFGLDLDGGYFAEVLRVEGVADTNLVEMIAEGSDSQWLPALVNTWIDEYVSLRAEDIEQRKRLSMQQVEGELGEMAGKIEQSRDALEDYRREHDIISAQREENEVLARLDGLNQALNAAIAEEVTTKAYFDTVRESLARGSVFIPPSQMASLRALEVELQALRAEMLEMTRRYTMDYINKQPKLRAVQERITELEQEIATGLSEGQQLELESARQAHAAASRTALELGRKLEEHKAAVVQFNRIYATHQSLVDDLAGLEELNRERQARLVQMEVRRVEKYPQVTVIERPNMSSERIGPDYLLMLGATLAAAFTAGVVTVWLYGFLGDNAGRPAYVTLSGVHMYPPESAGDLPFDARQDPRLETAHTRLLAEESREDDNPHRDDGGGR